MTSKSPFLLQQVSLERLLPFACQPVYLSSDASTIYQQRKEKSKLEAGTKGNARRIYIAPFLHQPPSITLPQTQRTKATEANPFFSPSHHHPSSWLTQLSNHQ